MEQIKSMTEMEGKTIKRTAYTDNHLFFFFTDDTYAIAKGCGWEERDVEISDETYNLEPNDYNLYELKKIGILDEQQYQKLQGEKEKRSKEVKQKRELEKLAELKRKYPDS